MSTTPRSQGPDPATRRGGRRSVATFNRYPDAQRAVDYLSDERFPVQHVSIVGEGLRLVEDVTGRRGYVEAALGGATAGAVV
ncbi:MAG: glycine zipper family protein, partial [Actinomycetota bacterium]|nr:glycine zipper family protein [Actinomycetota bacterium]